MRPLYVHLDDDVYEALYMLALTTKNKKSVIVNDALRQYLEK